MAVYTLRLSRSRLQAAGVQGGVRLIRRVTRRVDNRSAVLCPVDTGYLRASRTSGVSVRGGIIAGHVTYTADYAATIHEGRRALTIRAKGNGRLRFSVDGRIVYARQVHQPARPGRPWLATALREVAAQEGLRVTVRTRPR